MEEWAQRAFQGAFFDWVAANAMLPDEDTEHDGMKKIDRITVTDIQEIAGQARSIENQYKDVNSGLNPLGLASSAVPFDINPARLDPSLFTFATHFEQVYERAEEAMDNARAIFDHASDLKNQIRQVAASTEEFKTQTIEQDRDYRNRLIAILGTPYEGTIGTGKTYPPGYKGPDYFYYNYIDVNEVSEETVPGPSERFDAYFAPINRSIEEPDGGNVGEDGLPAVFSHFFESDLDDESVFTALPSPETLTISYPVSTASDYSVQAPADWGLRRSPGEIQEALIEMVKAEADFNLTLFRYAGLLGDIDAWIRMLEAVSNINADQIDILDEAYDTQKSLGKTIVGLRSSADALNILVEENRWNTQAIKDGLPTAVGLSNDSSFAARGALDALSMYRQAFDLAARYVYLSAKV